MSFKKTLLKNILESGGYYLSQAISGISLAEIRSYYRYSNYRSGGTLAFFVSTALCSLTCLLAYPVSSFFKNSAFILPTIVMSFTFIFRSMTLVRGALIVKQMKFAWSRVIISVRAAGVQRSACSSDIGKERKPFSFKMNMYSFLTSFCESLILLKSILLINTNLKLYKQ